MILVKDAASVKMWVILGESSTFFYTIDGPCHLSLDILNNAQI